MGRNRNERGLALIEIIVAVAISGLLLAGASGALIQVLESRRNSEHMTALRQVQSAGYWISRDALQAQWVETSGSGCLLYLERIGIDDNLCHEVCYSFQAMVSGLKELKRQEFVGGNPTTSMIVARYIDPSRTRFNWNSTNKMLFCTIAATVNGQTETRRYDVRPRALGNQSVCS